MRSSRASTRSNRFPTWSNRWPISVSNERNMFSKNFRSSWSISCFSPFFALFKTPSTGRQISRDVVIDDEQHQHHDADESDLEHGFLDGDAEVAAHGHFDEEHEDAAAVENRDGKEVKDGHLEADHGHKVEESGRAFTGGIAGKLDHADGAGEVLGGHAALQHALEDLAHEESAVQILFEGFVERGGQRKLRGDERDFLLGRDADHVTRLAVEFGENRRNADGVVFALAAVFDLDGIATGFFGDLVELHRGVDRLAIDGDQQVAFLEAGLFGGVSGLDALELNFGALVPAGITNAQAFAQNRGDGGVE